MNWVEKKILKALHPLHIYSHDGKEVIQIRRDQLFRGTVLGNSVLGFDTPLSKVGSVEKMNIRNQVAEALGKRPAVISRKLAHGEMIIYHGVKES
jgi:hypothetical protein